MPVFAPSLRPLFPLAFVSVVDFAEGEGDAVDSGFVREFVLVLVVDEVPVF